MAWWEDGSAATQRLRKGGGRSLRPAARTSSAPPEAAPELIQQLWGFARAGYLDNPMPAVFKERLFVWLSRFCPMRYCIVRHVGFLLGQGHGHAAGDASAVPQTIEQIVELLRRPTPWQRDMAPVYARLEELAGSPRVVAGGRKRSRRRDLRLRRGHVRGAGAQRASQARRAPCRRPAALRVLQRLPGLHPHRPLLDGAAPGDRAPKRTCGS